MSTTIDTPRHDVATPPSELPKLPRPEVRSRLAASDPRCLAPQLARVNTGPCLEDDPRRVEARARHGQWLRRAPPAEALDELEARCRAGKVSPVRQVSPGVYPAPEPHPPYCDCAECFPVFPDVYLTPDRAR